MRGTLTVARRRRGGVLRTQRYLLELDTKDALLRTQANKKAAAVEEFRAIWAKLYGSDDKVGRVAGIPLAQATIEQIEAGIRRLQQRIDLVS